MKTPIDKLVQDLKNLCGIDLLSDSTKKQIVDNAKSYQKTWNTHILKAGAHVGSLAVKRR